ncbi:MAG: hypothetical protein R2734_05500 [Nocardioides sp.]
MLTDGGYDVVGDLAALEPPDLTGRRHPSEVTDSELLTAAVSAIAALTTDVRARTRERDDALARLAADSDDDTAGVTMTGILTKLGSRAGRARRGKKSS